MKSHLGRENNHIENIDKRDWTLLFMPHMLEEDELRYRLVVTAMQDISPKGKGLTIIDMACGRGYGTEILAANLVFAKVIGLDLRIQYVERARDKEKQRGKNSFGIKYIQADVLHTPLADKSADAIAMFEILEHIPKHNQLALLQEAFRISKKGGLVMVSLPLPYSFDAAGNRSGASSNPFHQYEPTAEDVMKLAQKAGFQVVKRYGQSFASKRGVKIASTLESKLCMLHIPAWTIFAINLNFIRDPKPKEMREDDEQSQKMPLTQIFVLKK